MRCVHDGKTYRIKFKHVDNRRVPVVSPETGDPLGWRPASKKEMRKAGGAGWTSCEIVQLNPKVAGNEAEPKLEMEELVVATAKVRYSPKDVYNKAHGRWYALERALGYITDLRLVRALRKAYYAHVAWRPDGRDGFKIVSRVWHKDPRSGGVKRELERVHARR